MRPDATRQRIALFGKFGTGNLGNEATLQAVLYNLRSHLPNAEISCICSGPEYTASQYNISAVPIRAPFSIWKQSNLSSRDAELSGASNGSISATATEPHQWIKAFAKLGASLRFCAYPLVEAYRSFKAFAKLKDNNILIMPGTGMLSDYATGPFDLHYDIFRWAVIAKLCRMQAAVCECRSGADTSSTQQVLRRIMALADYRSYRDASSKDHLEAIGVDVTNDAVYPDLAFSLPIPVLPINDGLDHQKSW